MNANETLSRGSQRKLWMLRDKISAGVNALERGEFTDVADADLERYLEALARAEKPAPKR